jgi:hypothetical protein
MKYVRYESLGNTVGLENDINDYWEIGPDGFVERSINVQSDGSLLKYSRDHPADQFGALPEGAISKENLEDENCGKCTRLTASEFEFKWAQKAKNWN